jgi:hypothetical protein
MLVRCNKADDARCVITACIHRMAHEVPSYVQCNKWRSCSRMKVRCVKVKEEEKT